MLTLFKSNNSTTKVLDTIPEDLKSQLKKEVLQEAEKERKDKLRLRKQRLTRDQIVRPSVHFKQIKQAIEEGKIKPGFSSYFKFSFEEGKKKLIAEYDCDPFVIQFDGKTFVFDAKRYGDADGYSMDEHIYKYEPKEGAPLPAQVFKPLLRLLGSVKAQQMTPVTGKQLEAYEANSKKFIANNYTIYGKPIAVWLNGKLFIFDLEA